MLSELGASPSSYSGLVSSSTEPHPNTGHGVVHLWKERNGVRLCGLARTEETGPLLCLVKSHGGFIGLRRDYGHHRT